MSIGVSPVTTICEGQCHREFVEPFCCEVNVLLGWGLSVWSLVWFF